MPDLVCKAQSFGDWEHKVEALFEKTAELGDAEPDQPKPGKTRVVPVRQAGCLEENMCGSSPKHAELAIALPRRQSRRRGRSVQQPTGNVWTQRLRSAKLPANPGS